MSSLARTDWLNFVVTPQERLDLLALARRLRSTPPLPAAGVVDATSTPPSSASARPGDFVAGVSRRALRLFAAVYTVSNLYENFLLGGLRRKPFLHFLRDLGSRSSLRLAAFVASYSASYRLILALVRRHLASINAKAKNPAETPLRLTLRRRLVERLRSTPYLAPFLAGVLAGPTILIDPRGQRRVSIALYALTRAGQGGWDAFARKGLVPRSMREGRWWWGGHLLFAASNAVLLHAFVFDNDCFPATYSNFILKYSRAYLPSLPPTYRLTTPWPTSRQIVDGITTSARQHYPPYISPSLHPDLSRQINPAKGIPLLLPILAETHPGHTRLTCAFLHPNETSCSAVFADFAKNEFRGAAKFFGALALLGTALRWKKAITNPEGAISRALLSTVTSSAFLSLSIGTAWSTICLFQQYLPHSFIPTKRFYVQGFLAGLWVALVDLGTNGGGRSTDLGLYSARLALQTAWDVLVKQGKVRNIPNGDVLYFGLSMGTLMSLHEVNPKAIRSDFVRAALRQLGGTSSADEGVKGGRLTN